MKKTLNIVIILFFMLSFASCSGEAVPFSEKLTDNRDCYMDVVEIMPQSYVDDVVFLYCECKLADGSTAWMEIFHDDFIEFFDNEVNADTINYDAKKITYENPVRLNGKVNKIKDIINSTSDIIKVFYFCNADKAETLNGKKESAAVAFSSEAKNNTVVYADVVQIESKYSTYTISPSYPDSVICCCTTPDGDSVWMHISIDDYHEYFDKSASFKTDFINPSNARVLEFTQPVRIYGITMNKNDNFNSLTAVEIPNMLFDFMEVDKEQVNQADIAKQPPVKYSGTEKVEQQVFAEITSVTPEYVLYTHYTIPTNLICSCTTSDGENITVVFGIGTYKENISDDYAEHMGEERHLPGIKKISGRIKESQSLASDLEAEIGQDKIFVCYEITED